MKAVGLTRYLPIDDPDSLVDLELDKPQSSGRDLLVAVKAIAVNPVDFNVRAPKGEVEESPKVHRLGRIGYRRCRRPRRDVVSARRRRVLRW